MIERSLERFDLYPSRLLGDSGYRSAEMLAWLVYEHGIEPHVTVFDKSARTDGTFSREDFTYNQRTSRRLRKKVEMLFAHLKRILKLDRLRLRGPNGAHDEFTLAATAQNLRKMAKLIPMQILKPA